MVPPGFRGRVPAARAFGVRTVASAMWARSTRVKRSRIFALGVPTSNGDVRRALPASIGRSGNARRVG